jgi:uncharacterized protein (TIGR02996 family)
VTAHSPALAPLSSDQEAFLAAIAASPEEDTPRLAYADWLDEHGDHDRARFIRLQIDESREPGRKGLREEADGLLAANGRQWVEELGLPVANSGRPAMSSGVWEIGETSLIFWRGFVHHVSCAPAQFARLAESLFRRHPVTAVTALARRSTGPEAANWLRPVLDRPELGRIKFLGLSHSGVADRHVYELVCSRNLGPALALGIRETSELTAAGVRALGSLPRSRLTGLFASACGWARTRGSTALDRETIRVLIDSECCADLEELELGESDCSDELIAELARSRWPLRDLILRGDRATAAGLAALLSSPVMAALRSLELRGTGTGDDGARLIAVCPAAAGLRGLCLAHCGLGDAGAAAIADSPHLAALERLEVDKAATISPETLAALGERFGGCRSEGDVLYFGR